MSNPARNYLIERNFTYHPPQEGQPEKYEAIRNRAKEFAYLLNLLCPQSRELSVAMTNLEQVVFWANAAIARCDPPSLMSPEALQSLQSSPSDRPSDLPHVEQAR